MIRSDHTNLWVVTKSTPFTLFMEFLFNNLGNNNIIMIVVVIIIIINLDCWLRFEHVLAILSLLLFVQNLIDWAQGEYREKMKKTKTKKNSLWRNDTTNPVCLNIFYYPHEWIGFHSEFFLSRIRDVTSSLNELFWLSFALVGRDIRDANSISQQESQQIIIRWHVWWMTCDINYINQYIYSLIFLVSFNLFSSLFKHI